MSAWKVIIPVAIGAATIASIAYYVIGLKDTSIQSDAKNSAQNADAIDWGTDQNWSDEKRKWWYRASQGSRLLPLTWAQALERADSDEKVFGQANATRFGYLADSDNPDALPLGFAVDEDRGYQVAAGARQFPVLHKGGVLKQRWVGLTCAACHTSEIEYDKATLRIEGAATQADFEGFFGDVLAGLTKTCGELDHKQKTCIGGQKFDRFSSSLKVAPITLKSQLYEIIAWEEALFRKNHPNDSSSLTAGFGRLDAQGHILSKVSLLVAGSGAFAIGKPFPSDAPASYPFIWNAPQHDVVQWNGIARNAEKPIVVGGKPTDVGALGRNIGEVVGVFAHVDVARPGELGSYTGYRSTVHHENMIKLERQLGELRSPKWPIKLFGLDHDAALRGKQLFKDKTIGGASNKSCADCHTPLLRTDLSTRFKVEMTPLAQIGTDIWLACNTYSHDAVSGNVKGRWSGYFLGSGEKFGDKDKTAAMLTHVVSAVIVDKAGSVIGGLVDDFFNVRRRIERFSHTVYSDTPLYLPGVADPDKKDAAKRCIEASIGKDERPKPAEKEIADRHLAYKGRPLNGVWATAPFLHNGSVPTLDDLLLPSQLQNKEGFRLPLRACEADVPHKGCACAPQKYRPETFRVGSKKFDPIRVGFLSEDGVGSEFRVRKDDGTPILGNYNSGHEYGTLLNECQRHDLVEYLKIIGDE